MNVQNLGPGLGRGKVYEPKIFGFKVSERARSGPRMTWLRNRPLDIRELDEATLYGTAEESEDDVDGNGVRTQPRQTLGSGKKSRRPNGGSPMSIVDANGEFGPGP